MARYKKDPKNVKSVRLYLNTTPKIHNEIQKNNNLEVKDKIYDLLNYCLDNHVKIRQFIENQPTYGKY